MDQISKLSINYGGPTDLGVTDSKPVTPPRRPKKHSKGSSSVPAGSPQQRIFSNIPFPSAAAAASPIAAVSSSCSKDSSISGCNNSEDGPGCSSEGRGDRQRIASDENEIRPLGNFTRRALEVWKKYVGSTQTTTSDCQTINLLFRGMEVIPLQAQLHEMLQLSRKTRRHTDTYLSYGVFSFYVAEMKYSEKITRCNPCRKISCGSPSLRKACRSSSQHSYYDVFLGGSCNPTQWRRDQAIPALKQAQVTYYNPQRSDWRPELIELEQQAKENARVLLFVHDKETRSLASMVEAGELSARRKQLILAIEDQGKGVMGEALSDREMQEMQRARNYMRSIAEACRVRVHAEIEAAVQGCIDIVKGHCKPNADETAPICDKNLGEKFIKIHSAFDNHSTNDTLSIPERRMAFRASTGRELPKELLMADTDSITFDQYCMINAEYRMMVKPNLLKVLGISWPSERYLPQYREPEKVFIGGPTGAKDWRTTVALPHFKKEHVSFRTRNDDSSKHFLPMEMQQIESCKILLFVFPSDTWGAPEMIMASFYIGLEKFKVVLCIQDVSVGSQIYGEKVSTTQAKDYNRGRSYLSDQATRSRVPVYSDITEAVAKAAELAKE
ncbi:uncharacterized protein LOC111266627 isoform X1 [Varroa jacobsoni]|uniref:Uncharacterized protein n=2 Tax=Varroa TaxID=62624 RepID=A0A7M7IXX2_VARDE|nr:uncharacterized protein LOC111243012 isoform X2 [Varroa destructor]XP_022699999.1 uncharacterized protein LOC111266627 isoform X1 [Varroa jacobsoni]